MSEVPTNGNAVAATQVVGPAVQAAAPPLLVLAAFAALLLWFSFPAFLGYYEIWESYSYSHGYLVFALAAWLAYTELRRAPLAPLSPSWVGTAALLPLVLVVWAGYASSSLNVSLAALPVLWMVAIWGTCGTRNARRLFLPLGYLYFAIPIWEITAPPLQDLAVWVVSAWIRAVNVPAFIDGDFIRLPRGSFEVLEGCAGVRYVLVASALAMFGGLQHHQRWKPRLVLLVSAVVLALIGNWVRIFIIVMTGYLSGMEHAIITGQHFLFGWAVFITFMTPVFLIDRLLQARSPAPTQRVSSACGNMFSAWRGTVVYAGCAALAIGIWLNGRLAAADAPFGSVALAAPTVSGWERIGDWNDMHRPQYVGATTEATGWYVSGTDGVGAYVAHYPIQQQAHEVVYVWNRPQGATARIGERRPVTLTVASGAALPFRELEVDDSVGVRRLVWIAWRVAGRVVASELPAKALQLAGAVRGRHDAQALVLTAACHDDCAEARSALSRFAVAAAVPLLDFAERSWHAGAPAKIFDMEEL